MTGTVRRARLPAALALLAGLTLPADPVAGQSVMGEVVESGSARPVPGALVRLVAPDASEVAGGLTDERGRFLLRAPRPGRYTVRAERIGLATVTSGPFDLETGRTVRLTLETTPRPIELEGIDVGGARRCVVRPGEGLVVSELWEEARKALANQEWSEDARLLRFRVVEWQRELDRDGDVVLSEDRTPFTWIRGNPMRSESADTLLEHGFMRPHPEGGWSYFAPDATVLLSDRFLDTHCLGLAPQDLRPGLVGIRFEPVEGRTVPEIEGILWLDREDGRLRFLEFDYTTSPWDVARGVAGGRVEFEEVEGGIWIVRSWWIRMPRVELDAERAARGHSALRLTGLLEVGGEVTRIDALVGSLATRAPTGSVVGTVRDSARAAPLAGAIVRLGDSRFSAVTDAAGRFRMDAVPVGRYDAEVDHPRVDSVGVWTSGGRVEVRRDRATEVALVLPPPDAVLAALCPAGMEENRSAVVGTVHDRRTGDPVRNAVVTLSWTDFRVAGGRDVLADVTSLTARTDGRGRYRACGVPPGERIEGVAAVQEREGPVRRLNAPTGGVLRMDLVVESGGR